MSSSSGISTPSEPGRPATAEHSLTAWISKKDRVISFHPVPGFRPLHTRNTDAFWQNIRTLVEQGWRLQ